jgi:hypothetical protein
MSKIPAFIVEIEGEYLDAFIYSGALFLADFSGSLRSYHWQSLLGAVTFKKTDEIKDLQLLLDCRSAASDISNGKEVTESVHIKIGIDLLSRFAGASINLEEWPADISILSNRMYIASSLGVHQIKFERQTNGVINTFEPPLKIWEQASFKTAPNSMNRIAIASGDDGLLTIPNADRVSIRDRQWITSIPCNDCDWQKNSLIANTAEGAIEAEFESIPIKGGNDPGFWNRVNSAKSKPPRSIGPIAMAKGNAVSSWIGGEKTFAIDESHSLYVRDSSDGLESADFKFLKKLEFPEMLSKKYIYGRTSVFGTLLETTQSLNLISDSGMQILGGEVGRWRTFPRSKSYANQVHIVNESSLQILAFNYGNQEKITDKFGFSLSKIEDGIDERMT